MKRNYYFIYKVSFFSPNLSTVVLLPLLLFFNFLILTYDHTSHLLLIYNCLSLFPDVLILYLTFLVIYGVVKVFMAVLIQMKYLRVSPISHIQNLCTYNFIISEVRATLKLILESLRSQ